MSSTRSPARLLLPTRSLTHTTTFLLQPSFLPPQLIHLNITSSTINDLLAEDERLFAPRVSALFDFALPVEIGTTNVEAVDVGGDDAAEEEAGVDEGVGLEAGEEHYCEWGEEDVD